MANPQSPHASLLRRSVPTTENLPRVEFRRTAAVGPRSQPGKHEKLNESYGFNAAGDWEMPEAYLKWIQPLETDLSKQVEYDLDDTDQEWLDAVNAERRKEGLDAVTYEFFEVLMDKLEKEWFELSARIPKPVTAMSAEDQKCAICEDGDCENSNAIVFCDGCNLAVHQDCYGVPYIPEGQWLCRKCTVSPDKPVNCVLCPNEGGAFKQTTTGGWAHLLCAIWVPETGIANTTYMEPVDGVEAVPRSRWKLICYLCKKRVGAPIQCSNRSCFTAFHVTCARDYGLHLKLRFQTADYKAFCHKHAPREMGAAEPVLLLDTEDEGNMSGSQANRKRKRGEDFPPPPKPEKKVGATPKSSRAYSKTFAQGPPIIPYYIHSRLWEYVERVKLSHKRDFVALACRYWSLKREARRGAPLLKRLHLEPWTTAAAANGEQSDAEKATTMKLIKRLRANLENVRVLNELVKKREPEKLLRAQLMAKLINNHIFPYTALLRDALRKVVELDKNKIFFKPVDRNIVPDYYEVVKNPMEWSTMQVKMEEHRYRTAQELADDIDLVLHNAMIYNKKDTPFYKAAQRVQKLSEPIMEELKACDDPASAFQKHAAELMRLLDEDVVEAMFDVSYSTSPTPPAIEDSPPRPSKKAKIEAASPSPTRKARAAKDEEEKPAADILSEAEQNESQEEADKAAAIAERARKDAKNAAARAQRAKTRELREAKAANESARRERDRPRPRARKVATDEEEAEDEEVFDSEPDEGVDEEEGADEDEEPEAGSSSAEEEEIVGDGSLYTTDVTAHASFLSFNTGWILPEGSRRRRETESAPPASTSNGVKPAINGHQPKKPSHLRNSVAREVSESEADSGEEPDAEDLRASRSRSRSHKPSNADKKGKGKARAIEVEDEDEFEEVDDLAEEDELESEAEEGDEVEDAELAVEASKPRKPQVNVTQQKARYRALMKENALTKKRRLEDGSLVWAKMNPWPFWPAEVMSPKSASKLILKSQPDDSSALLVRFFDPHRTWGWIPREKTFVLGQSTELDDCMSSSVAVKGGSTRKRVQAALQAAHEHASGTMDED